MTKNGKTVAERLAEFAVGTRGDTISGEIFDHAKTAFMDWLGVTYGGMADPLVEKLITHADEMGGNPQATVVGRAVKTSVSHAALVNGTASHVLDYDDTLVSFFGHPSVTLFPSLLALSEWQGYTGRDFLIAYLVGLQVGGTIGVSAGLDHYMAGWHATSTIGHLASAAGCAKLLGVTERQFVYALGIAATQSCGLKRVFGTMCKPFHAGRASQAGLMAALLAQKDFSGPADILEGPQGFFELFKGGLNEEVLALLGLGWDVVNMSQKYHASCHATHSPLEAALEVVHSEKLAIEDISKITVHSSKMALDAAGNSRPATGREGKFSIPFCVANALVNGETGTNAFTDENVSDPAVTTLMEKITVTLDPEKIALEAHVDIETRDGKVRRGFSDILQQIPPLEIKKNRVGKKFLDLCGGVLTPEAAGKIRQKIDDLENISNMADFMDGLQDGSGPHAKAGPYGSNR
ncbi:MAG: MmgE/PrpD family protein [Desulfosalsimonadaceae bacterium]